MTDLERAEAAFLAAHKAGDSARAAVLAQHVRDLRQGTSQPSGSANVAGAGTGTPQGNSSAPGGIPGLVPGTQTVPSDSVTGTGMLTGDEDATTRARLGLAGAGVNAYLGLKNNFGKLDEEEQRVLKQSRDDIQRSGPAGKVANTVGQMGLGVATAIPARMLGLSRLVESAASPVVRGIGNYLRAAAGAGATESLMAPAEDQENIAASKLEQGGKAAAYGLGLKGVADVVQVPVRGLFRATKDAAKLMEQGVNPTLQQAAESPVGRWVGGLTTGATRVADRQGKELKQALADRVSRGQLQTSDSMTLNELNAMLEGGVQKEMGDLFLKKKLPLNNSIRDDVLSEADNLKRSGGRGLLQQNEARRALDNIVGTDRNAVRMSNETLQRDFMDPLNHEISRAKDPAVAGALARAKEILETRSRRSPLNKDERAALDDINARLYDIARMKEAAGAVGENSGVPLKAAVKAWGNQPDAALNLTNQELIGPLARTLERSPNQDMARGLWISAKRAAGPVAAAVGSGHPWALAPIYGTSLLGQTAGGARFLTGQQGWQKNLTHKLDSERMQYLADLLRSNQGASFTGN